VEGRVIHARLLPGGAIASGVNFKKLDKDLEGRRAMSKLTAIMGDLQREEVRRLRGAEEAAAAVEQKPAEPAAA
jgi:hypothetical protein